MPDPVILELAVNGVTPRSRNRHVPRDPDEIAEVALAGVELGASIIHNHNDEPMFTPDGVHAVEPYLASWGPVLERHPELLMYPTMAAGARGTSGSGWRTGPGRGSRATWTCCALWSIWSGGWVGSRPRSATPAGSSASARRGRDGFPQDSRARRWTSLDDLPGELLGRVIHLVRGL